MVGDLQKVDRREAAADQLRIDPLLDVSGEQEAAPIDFTQQHDRGIVDPGPCIGRRRRDGSLVGPQNAQSDVIDPEAGSRREDPSRDGECRQPPFPGGIARPRTQHRGREGRSHRETPEQGDEARDVVLVWMGQDDHVDPPVPRREPFIERDEEPLRIGATVDE